MKIVLWAILFPLLVLGCSISFHIKLFIDYGLDSAFAWAVTIAVWIVFLAFYGVGYKLGYSRRELEEWEKKVVERWRESSIANNDQKEEGK